MIFTIDLLLLIASIFLFGCYIFVNEKNKGLVSLIVNNSLILGPIFLFGIQDISFGKFVFTFSLTKISIITYILGFISNILLFLEQKKYSCVKFECFFLISIMTFTSSILANTSGNLILFYIITEVISLISIIILIGSFDNVSTSIENGMKYIILSIISSFFVLFSLVFIYFSTGNFDFQNTANIAYYMGILFFIISIFAKLGVPPFHLFVCDVYDCSKISPVNIINNLAKVGILGYIVLNKKYLIGNDVLNKYLIIYCSFAMIFVAIQSIEQKSFKRLIALSSGFSATFLIGYLLIVQNNDYYQYFIYYISAYFISSLLIFFSCFVLFKDTENINITNQNNFQYNSFFFISLIFAVLSTAGLPPFIGFFAKFLVLKQIFFLNDGVYIFYITSVIFSSILGSYYYLKIPLHFVIYKKENLEIDSYFVAIVCGILSILLFCGILFI